MFGVYCANFITVVGPVWMMFVCSVLLITVVESAFIDTYSVNSITLINKDFGP